MNAGETPCFETAFAGPISFPRLRDAATVSTQKRAHFQEQLRQQLANTLYGEIPAEPDNLRVLRTPIQGEKAEQLSLEIKVADRSFRVNAALWLPANIVEPVPLICGLDFVGPAGILMGQTFPLDPNARVYSRPEYGAKDGQLTDALRGTSASRWPVHLLVEAGYAVIVSCYGSWVPDDPEHWTKAGVQPLTGDDNARAISLWAWAIMRLLDAAETCPEIDKNTMSVAGHSRLGKAALWAAGNDPRIAAVFANQSGCGGAAPAAHPVGETWAQMTSAFPHWTRSPASAACDQHQLLALIAPRALYLAGAQSDLWADPLGSFASLEAASVMWETPGDWPTAWDIWDRCATVYNGSLGFHLRAGGHDLLPGDWRKFLHFMSAQHSSGA